MNAVYLIVAGVLLGPIESNCLQHGLVSRAEPQCVKRETTSETCERAMKEIGAVKDAIDNWWMPYRAYDVNKHQVLCIPAPTGLKR